MQHTAVNHTIEQYTPGKQKEETMHCEILTHASRAELITAVEENLFDLFRAMTACLDGSELFESDTISRHLTYPQNPMFKGAWRPHLAPDEVDEAIDETIAWFQRRKAPFFLWWAGPGSSPGDLGERLTAHGLIPMEEAHKQPRIMVADLGQMNEAALDQVPEGFTVEEIRDEQALDEYIRTFVAGFGASEQAGQSWKDATLQIGLDRMPWTMYLGRLRGEPVATSMLFNGGGVVGVFAVGTVAPDRGKGIGGAITLKPLLVSRAAGYRYAVLFSTAMGVHAYQRIGFQTTEERMCRYLWRAHGG